MKLFQLIRWPLAMGLCLLSLVGCQSKAKPQAQATPEGPVIPAANIQRGPTLADLTGGDLGIGGGFLIGAAPNKIASHLRADAVSAAQRAEQTPAQLQQVRESKTADLNNDGYVTLDEVLAMVRAGLSPQEISDRLTATQYVFHTTPEQERYLTDRGVTTPIITSLESLNTKALAIKDH